MNNISNFVLIGSLSLLSSCLLPAEVTEGENSSAEELSSMANLSNEIKLSENGELSSSYSFSDGAISSSSVENVLENEDLVSCVAKNEPELGDYCIEVSLSDFRNWDENQSFCEDDQEFNFSGCNTEVEKKCLGVDYNGTNSNLYLYDAEGVILLNELGGCEVLRGETAISGTSEMFSSADFNSSSSAIDIINDKNSVSCFVNEDPEFSDGLCLQVSNESFTNWPLQDEPFCDLELGHTFIENCDNSQGITCKGIVTEDNIVFNVSYYDSEMVEFINDMGGCEGLQELIDEGPSEPEEEFARLRKLF